MLIAKNKKSSFRRSSSLLAFVVLMMSTITPVSANESENKELKLSDLIPVLQILLTEEENRMLICNPFPECQISEMNKTSTETQEQNSSNNEQFVAN